MDKTWIAVLLILISIPVFAGEEANPAILEQAHAFDQPTNLTLSNFFSEGWGEAWTQRETPDGAPDIELLHGDTNFLERVFRVDYASAEETPGDRSIRDLYGILAYSFNRRFMLEVAPSYEWKEYRGGSATSGGSGMVEARFQLVDVPGSSYAFKVDASEPNYGLDSKQTAFSYGFGGWNDLTHMGLKRVGVYYSLDESTFAGPANAGTRRNEINYSASIAKTWTDPQTPYFGDLTTFFQLYGETILDGASRETSLDATPGVRFDLGRGNVLMAGVDLPLTYPHGFEATYRLTYIMNFDGKGSPVGDNQLTVAQSNDWTHWHLPYWNFWLSQGWDSDYRFRGEDLTPDADGFYTSKLEASTPGFAKDQTFTLGALGGLQMGEGNYEGLAPTNNGTPAAGQQLAERTGTHEYRPLDEWTQQKSDRELDLSAKYTMNLGSDLVAEAGDILYFSEFDANTKVYLESADNGHFVATGTRYMTKGYSYNSRGSDRNDIYLSLSTNPNLWEHVIPKLTYYETFNERKSYETFLETGSESPFIFGHSERVDAPAYGGYLEGRVDGYMSLMKKDGVDILSLRPYVLLSVSFNDATQGTANFGRKYFTGWDETEVGVEAPYRVNQYITISATLACAHNFNTPDASTSRNEVWGGGKVTFAF